jgi:manganese/zinc/iron transport system permease protein
MLIVILVAVLTAVSCALNGSLLVLRKQALAGDAISHAVLPGIALFFLISGDRTSPWLLPSAGLFGVATVFLTDALRKSGRMASDAALGIVFTSFFAAGVVLISKFAGDIDLDQECVLYGEIAYTPWDRFSVGDADLGVRALWLQGVVIAATLAFLRFAAPSIAVYTFDEAYGASTGMRMRSIHLLATLLVSVTIVASFESVGAILVVALLIIPPAAAILFASSIRGVLAGSVIFGAVSALSGVGLSAAINASISAAIASVALVFFLVLLVVHRFRKQQASKTT